MDDRLREAWRLVLDEAIVERARLDEVIAYYSDKLGVAPAAASEVPPSDDPARSANSNPGGPASPLILVSEGEFWGQSTTKATSALLAKSGRTRPLKTKEILACLLKGGVRLGGKNPEGGLYRSLMRDPRFTNVGKSTWGLSAWYPNKAAGAVSNISRVTLTVTENPNALATESADASEPEGETP